jgi:hypothetical protein
MNDSSKVISRLDIDERGDVQYFGPSSNMNLVSDVPRIPADPWPSEAGGLPSDQLHSVQEQSFGTMTLHSLLSSTQDTLTLARSRTKVQLGIRRWLFSLIPR